jgi:ribosomal protein S18 acetylase RimI-like enzyme
MGGLAGLWETALRERITEVILEGVELRPMKYADIPHVARLVLEAFGPETALKEPWTIYTAQQHVEDNFTPEDGYCSVAVLGQSRAIIGAFLGFKEGFAHGQELYIDLIVVEEKRRGHGIGTKILITMLEKAQKEGLVGARLVTHSLLRSMAWYVALGFDPTYGSELARLFPPITDDTLDAALRTKMKRDFLARVKLRPMQPEDIPQVIELVIQAFGPESRPREPWTAETAEQHVRDNFDPEGRFCWVAELMENNTVVGAFLGDRISFEHGPELYINRMVVASEFQGRGIGSYMMTTLFQAARREGLVGIRLVNTLLLRSISWFCTDLGFRPTQWQELAICFDTTED